MNEYRLVKKQRTLPSGKRTFTWTARRNVGGKWKTKSIGKAGRGGMKRSDAEAIVREMNHARIRGEDIPRETSGRTLVQFFADVVIAERHAVSAPTVEAWEIAGRHLVAAVGDVLMSDLDDTLAGRFREHLSHREANTVNTNLRTLRGLFNKGKRRGWLLANPLDIESIQQTSPREMRFYSRAEQDAMRKAADPWWSAMIDLAILSGLRQQELLHLRWPDVTADGVRVQYRDEPLAWKPKNRHSVRTVPVDALSLVEPHRRPDLSPYVFVDIRRLPALVRREKAGTFRSHSHMVPDMHRKFARVRDKAGVAPGVFHDLRKTFGTRAATAGVPMHELRAHMGHADISTTAKFYTGVVEQSAANRLRAALA